MIVFPAIFITVFWCTVSLLIAWSRGYTPGGIALCLAGIIGGGIGAALPGAYALESWDALMHSHGEGTVACAAVLVGALCGLYVTERLRDHEFPSPRQLLTAFFGFLFGLMAAAIIFAFTYGTWAQSLGLFGFIPATIGSATLAGSAISHAPVD